MRRAAGVAALTVLLTGCTLVRGVQRGVASIAVGDDQATQEELRNDLFLYGSSFHVLVSAAADQISSETIDTRVRRLTLLWKIRLPDAAALAVSMSDPREAYVASLALAIAQRQFLEEGGGKEMFGAQQPVAIEAAREVEDRAVAVGETFLEPSRLDGLRAKLETLARENPIRGEFRRESIVSGLRKAKSGGLFSDIVGLPMAPFRALEGVDAGAQAIREFNVTAQRATELTADLPERIRWELELLSYDLQAQGGAVEQALASFETLASAAETLPEETRATLEAAGAELEQRSAVLQTLLADYRAALADTSRATTDVAAFVDRLAHVSEQLAQAGSAWGGLVTELRAPGPPPPPGSPPRRPFDVLEYERTAQSIARTVEELRLLLTQLHEQQESLGSALLRPIVTAGLVLIAAFFAALLAYRILVARLLAPR